MRTVRICSAGLHLSCNPKTHPKANHVTHTHGQHSQGASPRCIVRHSRQPSASLQRKRSQQADVACAVHGKREKHVKRELAARHARQNAAERRREGRQKISDLENVKANAPQLVHVGVIYFRQESNLGRRHGVLLRQEQFQLVYTPCARMHVTAKSVDGGMVRANRLRRNPYSSPPHRIRRRHAAAAQVCF